MPARARPHVLLSVATSLDGYLDDSGAERLLLSNDADFDRVDEVRSGVDAILVGAGTIRSDNPRLMLRSDVRRQRRTASHATPDPLKVTLTTGGELDPAAAFFTTGECPKLVYTSTPALAAVERRLGGLATVVDAGDPLDPERLLADLAERGVERLLVEGGGQVATTFLAGGLVDELHLVLAPFLIGDPAAPRFARPAAYPQGPGAPLTLAEVRRIDDLVLLRYLAADR